jgi:glycosyltransferase involved in cell wall biosynthesis
MKLTLIYHVFKNITYLDKSLKSLFNQTDKDFELILVNDGATDKVIDVLNKFDFSSLVKSFKYIHINENQGHSFSFNEALRQCDSEYVYYLGSNIVLLPKFVEHINKIINNNNVDVISITHAYDKKKPSITTFTSLNGDLRYSINPSIRDKIFSRSFLNNNNIWLDEEGYFPLMFLYKVLSSFKS